MKIRNRKAPKTRMLALVLCFVLPVLLFAAPFLFAYLQVLVCSMYFLSYFSDKFSHQIHRQ